MDINGKPPFPLSLHHEDSRKGKYLLEHNLKARLYRTFWKRSRKLKPKMSFLFPHLDENYWVILVAVGCRVDVSPHSTSFLVFYLFVFFNFPYVLTFQSIIYFFKFLFIYLFFAAPRSMWDLSFPTRDRTHTPCSGSVES